MRRFREALQALRHDGVFWRRLAYLGTAHSPWWWRRYTPAGFGTLLCALLPKQRHTVTDNFLRMKLAKTPLEARLAARRMFVAFAESLTDGLESGAKGVDGYELASPDHHRLKEAHAGGRGVILLTAHTGSWEIVGRLIGKNHGFPVTMVMTREHNASTRAFADALRTQKKGGDFEVAYVGTDPLAALPLVAALRRNRVVALQFDRVPAGMSSLSVPFFGWMQPFPVGPFKLAQVTGAPVVVALTRRTGFRRYTVEIPVVLHIERRGGEAALLATMAKVARAVEDFVRNYPSQWFHFEKISEVPATAPASDVSSTDVERPESGEKQSHDQTA